MRRRKGVIAVERGLLHSAEVFRDFGLAPINWADKFAPNHTIAVNDITFGNLESAIHVCDWRDHPGIASRPTFADGEQIDVVIFQKFVISVGIIIDAYRQHSDVGSAKFLLQLHERRHFINTGRAPGSPEIQDDNLAPQLTKRDASVRVFDREVWSGFVNSIRLGVVASAGGKRKNE